MCDDLTEIPPFCWVITTCQCYKLFDRGQMATALHYTEFHAIFLSPPEMSMMQRSFPPRVDQVAKSQKLSKIRNMVVTNQ